MILLYLCQETLILLFVYTSSNVCPFQALLCSCFVPFYCGIIPPTYCGVVRKPADLYTVRFNMQTFGLEKL